MQLKNFEFKAKVVEIESYECKLLTLNPLFKGIDYQIDTYFDVPKGRLKLREGNIENALIQYERVNSSVAKLSDIVLYKHLPDMALKNILTYQFGVKAVVEKVRKIYFIENVKFHFDEVKNLGTFLEVEAIDEQGNLTIDFLKNQCDYFFTFLGLKKNQLIDRSYSDFFML